MADPTLFKRLNNLSPRIDDDGDILVSTASTTSSESDSAFGSENRSITDKKSPAVLSKNFTPPSTPRSSSDPISTHTTPTLRDATKQKFGSPLPPYLLQQLGPFSVVDMLESAIIEGEPLLVEIFGREIIKPLKDIAKNLPKSLSVAAGEKTIKPQVRLAATVVKTRSKKAKAALKAAALQVQDLDTDQRDKIIREAKKKIEAKEKSESKGNSGSINLYADNPAWLGNAAICCKTVFQILRML